MNNLLQYNPTSKQVTLCARKTCCPKMEIIDENTVKIIDDNGNEVVMSVEQAKLITSGLDLLTEKRKQLLHD